jgi:hypothetical protein
MSWYGMLGQCMFGQKCQGNASYGKVLEDNAFKGNAYNI